MSAYGQPSLCWRPDTPAWLGFKRFVLPAELGQQLAVDFLEIVTHPVSELALPIKSAPAFHPGQGLIRFLSSLQFSDSQAVLRFKPGLFGECNISWDVSLCAVDRAQNLAPAPAGILRRLSRNSFETLSHLLLEGTRGVGPPAVLSDHAAVCSQMIKTLELSGFVERTPGQARSIRLLVLPEHLPKLG